MPKVSDCPKCGAALPVPDDVSVLHVFCRYCGTEQPLSDVEARTRAVRERAYSDEIRQDIRKNQRSARNFSRMMMLPGFIIGGVCLVAGLWPVFKMSFGNVFASWDGSSALDCGGVENMTISGVTANVSGTAVYARGNCQLTLENCRITASTAIEASDNAHVIVRGGSVTGAIDANGNAVIDNRGARANGKVRKQQNARVTGFP